MANTQIDVTANGTIVLATAGKYCDRNIDVNVNVPSQALPTSFTNVLTHESTVISLNKDITTTGESDYNGLIVVYIDLVGLGFTTHPAELTFRWRGMYETPSPGVCVSTDKTTWVTVINLYSCSIDEHGDFKLYKVINYPTANRYLRMSFKVKGNKQTVTQEDVNKCILTINEPIGNGGYVG